MRPHSLLPRLLPLDHALDFLFVGRLGRAFAAPLRGRTVCPPLRLLGGDDLEFVDDDGHGKSLPTVKERLALS
jgi:hypothetical protein